MRRRTIPVLAAAAALLAACGQGVVGPTALQEPLTYREPSPGSAATGSPSPARRLGSWRWRQTGRCASTCPCRPRPASVARAAPLEDDQAVYAGSGGSLVALDPADGHPRWEARDQGEVAGLWLHDAVAGSTTGHLLVALLDQVSDHPHLVALDRSDGHQVWRDDLASFPVGDPKTTEDGGLAWVDIEHRTQVLDLDTGTMRWSAPTTMEFPGFAPFGGLLLRTTEDAVLGLDVRTGAERWRADAVTTEMSPVVMEDVIVLSEWDPTRSLYSTIRALDAGGRQLWRRDTKGNGQIFPAGGGQALVLDDRPSTMTRVDLHDGTSGWTVDTTTVEDAEVTSNAVVTVESTPATQEPAATVARSLLDGHELWRAPLGSRRHLAASAGTGTDAGVVVGQRFPAAFDDDEAVVALDLATGSVRSETPATGSVQSTATSPRGVLVQSEDSSQGVFCSDRGSRPGSEGGTLDGTNPPEPG